MRPGTPYILDAYGNPIRPNRIARRLNGQARSMFSGFSGFKGANDDNLTDWVFLPLEINTILRNDLRKLRARSRDLARNDDTCKRFLEILKQNVLGHTGILLQARHRFANGKPNKSLNDSIEKGWRKFGRKRRRGGFASSPSACGQMTLRQIAWLTLWNEAIDGEYFLNILRGYPHNPHKFAVRFLNPDLLDSCYDHELENGNRVEMGIEFDEFDRPVAYHFNVEHPTKAFKTTNQARVRIPASQIIHGFRREYTGQIRGIPRFAAIMHKAKMLNGVHEAIVVGWRVAASKMGFFTPGDDEGGEWEGEPFATGDADDLAGNVMDATPGSFEVLKRKYDLKLFDPEYPSSTYESGHQVFMQQMANGLNVSSPTLANNYAKVNYSSLRQALLEDRSGWRCIQAEMIDGFYQPLFDEWYAWASSVMKIAPMNDDPEIVWRPRGWPWVDPEKEVNAQIKAINASLRTRQDTMDETTGAEFSDTVDVLAEERDALVERGLPVNADASASDVQSTPSEDNQDE